MSSIRTPNREKTVAIEDRQVSRVPSSLEKPPISKELAFTRRANIKDLRPKTTSGEDDLEKRFTKLQISPDRRIIARKKSKSSPYLSENGNGTNAKTKRKTSKLKNEIEAKDMKMTKSKQDLLKLRQKKAEIVKKISLNYRRIIDNMNLCEQLIEAEDEYCAKEDMKRKEQRALEFSVRFYRNYIYQLRRKVSDLRKTMVPSIETIPEPQSIRVLNKIAIVYNLASQALQVYTAFVSAKFATKIPNKLCELVKLLSNIYSCSRHIVDPYLPENESGSYFEQKCKTIVTKANFITYKDESFENLTFKQMLKTDPEKVDLPMYRSKFTLPNCWKKTSEKLARMKFGAIINSRKKKDTKVKTSKAVAEIYSRFATVQAEVKKPVAPIKRRRKIREDDIKTMVQSVEDDNDCNRMAEKREGTPRDPSSQELRRILQQAIEKLNTEKVTPSTLENIIKSMSKHSFNDRESVSSENTTSRVNNVRVYHCQHVEELPAEVTVDADNSKEEKNKDEIKKERKLKQIFRRENEVCEENINDLGKAKIKLDVKPKVVKRTLKYKKTFKEYLANNNLYKSCIVQKPWTLLARISDKMIDEVIAEIASEMINNHFIKRLYEHEMKEIEF